MREPKSRALPLGHAPPCETPLRAHLQRRVVRGGGCSAVPFDRRVTQVPPPDAAGTVRRELSYRRDPTSRRKPIAYTRRYGTSPGQGLSPRGCPVTRHGLTHHASLSVRPRRARTAPPCPRTGVDRRPAADIRPGRHRHRAGATEAAIRVTGCDPGRVVLHACQTPHPSSLRAVGSTRSRARRSLPRLRPPRSPRAVDTPTSCRITQDGLAGAAAA